MENYINIRIIRLDSTPHLNLMATDNIHRLTDKYSSIYLVLKMIVIYGIVLTAIASSEQTLRTRLVID